MVRLNLILRPKSSHFTKRNNNTAMCIIIHNTCHQPYPLNITIHTNVHAQRNYICSPSIRMFTFTCPYTYEEDLGNNSHITLVILTIFCLMLRSLFERLKSSGLFRGAIYTQKSNVFPYTLCQLTLLCQKMHLPPRRDALSSKTAN